MMVIKESSDDLTPIVPTAKAVRAGRSPRSAKDYLAIVISTCVVGYMPIAPGTWGSLVGVGFYVLLQFFTARVLRLSGASHISIFRSAGPVFMMFELLLITLLVLLGIWAASRAESIFQKKDPGSVVIDEVAGQMIALLPLLSTAVASKWWSIVLAFVLFRIFDIVKPYPCRRLEALEGGLGVMADDIVAGAYAAVGISIVNVVALFIH